MAPGLGKTWVTQTQLGISYYYDGIGVASISGSPPGRCVAVHKNRVWIAGTNAAPGRLWYSDIDDGTSWPTGNYIDVMKDSGEAIEDITPFEDSLLIGTRTTLWSLAGSGADNFVLTKYPIGGCAPGRTLCITPYGAVVAGRKNVWLVANGQSVLASRPIYNSYGMTGTFMTTSYVDDVAYVCDSASGTVWALNVQTGTWREERIVTAAERPVVVYNHEEMQVMGPAAATVGSLLNYRKFPGSTYGKDFDTLSETFELTTPEYWPEGPEYKITPRQLYLKIRQRGGNATQTGLTITPYYDGTAGTPHVVTPRASATVFRERMDLGEKSGINYIQFVATQTLLSGEAATFDIEEATLGYDPEEYR